MSGEGAQHILGGYVDHSHYRQLEGETVQAAHLDESCETCAFPECDECKDHCEECKEQCVECKDDKNQTEASKQVHNYNNPREGTELSESSGNSVIHRYDNLSMNDDSLLAAAENVHEPSYETPRSSEQARSEERESPSKLAGKACLTTPNDSFCDKEAF